MAEAGLSFGTLTPDRQGSQAGLNEPQTMADRQSLYRRMEKEGYSQAEIRKALGIENASREGGNADVPVDAGDPSTLENVLRGTARAVILDPLEGLGEGLYVPEVEGTVADDVSRWTGDMVGGLADWLGSGKGHQDWEKRLAEENMEAGFGGKLRNALETEAGDVLLSYGATALTAGAAVPALAAHNYARAMSESAQTQLQHEFGGDEEAYKKARRENPALYARLQGTAAATAVLETAADYIPILKGPAKELFAKEANKALSRAVARNGGKIGKQAIAEATTEFLQTVQNLTVNDPEVRDKLMSKDFEGAFNTLKEKHGEELGLAAAAGGVLGGGMRGATLPITNKQEKAEEDQMAARTERLQNIAAEHGLGEAELAPILADDKQRKEFVRNMAQLETTEDNADRMEAAAATAAASGTASEADVAEAQAAATEARKTADKARDEVFTKFGGKDTATVKAEAKAKDAEDRGRAIETLTSDGTKMTIPKDASTEQLTAAAEELDIVRMERAEAERKLADAVKPKRRREMQKEVDAATDREAETRGRIAQTIEGKDALATSEAFKEKVKSERAARQQGEEFETSVTEFRKRKYDGRPVEEQITKAKATLQKAYDNRTKNQEKRAAKRQVLEDKLDTLDAGPEFDKTLKEIDKLDAQHDGETPAVVAARRVLQDNGVDFEPVVDEQVMPADGKGTPAPAEQATPQGEAAQPEASGQAVSPPKPSDVPLEQWNALRDARKTGEGGEEAATAVLQSVGLPVTSETIAPLTMDGNASNGQRLRRAMRMAEGMSPMEAVLSEGPDALSDKEQASLRKSAENALGKSPSYMDFNALDREAKRRGTPLEKGDPNRETILKSLAKEILAEPEPSESNMAIEAGHNFVDEKTGRTIATWRPLVKEVGGAGAKMPEAEDAMRGLTEREGYEVSALFDADGNLLGAGTLGDPNFVSIAKTNWDAEGNTFTHTHPYPTPPSIADMMLLADMGDNATVRAVLPNGDVVEVRKLDNSLNRARVKEIQTTIDNTVLRAMEDGFVRDSMDSVAEARVVQEAGLRYMETLGLIEITQPMKGLNVNENTEIETILDFTDTGGGREADVGSGTAEAGFTPSGAAGTRLPQAQAGNQTQQGRPTTEDVIFETENLKAEVEAYMAQTGMSAGDALMQPEMRDHWHQIGELMTQVEGTNERAGYGTPADMATRQYLFEGETVIGRPKAVARLARDAMQLAAKETKMPPMQPRADREAIVIMGPPAAGKSSIAGKIAYDSGSAIVDSDEAKKVLPEYADGAGAAVVHEESSDLGKDMLKLLADRGINMVIPKVGDTLKSMQKTVDTLAAKGYTVRFVLQDVTPTSARERMASRFVKTGRLIPSFVSDNVGFKPQETFRQLVDQGIGAGHTALDGEVDYGQALPVKQTAGSAPVTGDTFDPSQVSVQRSGGGDGSGALRPQSGAGSDGSGGVGGTGPTVAAGLDDSGLTKPEAVREAADAIIERVRAQRGRPTNFRTALNQGQVTPEAVADVIADIVSADGFSLPHAIYHSADVFGGPNKNDLALYVINELDKENVGEIKREVFEVYDPKTKKPRGHSTVIIPQKMKTAFGAETPTKVRLIEPLADPNDVSDIKKGNNNLLAGTALERVENTIKIQQANHYEVIPEYVEGLTWKDMISSKAPQKFGEGRKKQAIDAQRKLARMKAAMNEARGRDVGFKYSVDKKGRTYPNGEFHPQAGETIKAMFAAKMPDGTIRPLAEMDSIDHTGSGWQIAAYIARDEVAAPLLNIAAGQAQQANPQKGDLYTSIMDSLTRTLRADAAAGNPHAQYFLQQVVDNPDVAFKRDVVKTPTIAIVYAGGETNFRDAFMDHYGHVLRDTGKGFWSYIGETAYEAVEGAAPATKRFKDWAVNGIRAAIEAADDPHQLTFTVGRDGTYNKVVYKEQDTQFRARDQRKASRINDVEGIIKEKLPEVDVNKTARNVFSQIIQGFDAAIMHEGVRGYRARKPDGFVTTNHDSYTVPPENGYDLAEAVKQAMFDVMGDVDVPARLRQEILDQTGVDIGEFTGAGSYDPNEVMTALPVWREGKGDQPDTPVMPPNAEQPTLAGGVDAMDKRGPLKPLRGDTVQGAAMQFSVPNTSTEGPTTAPLAGKTTKQNAAEQTRVLDELHRRHPDPLASEEAWVAYANDAFGGERVMMPPWRTIQIVNEGAPAVKRELKGMTDGMQKMSLEGLKTAKELGKAYSDGQVTPPTTAKMFLWSFLSRGVSPYVQEAAFLDAVMSPELDVMINEAVSSGWSPELAARYDAWASDVLPQGAPSRGTTHNLNAFGKQFLATMTTPDPQTGQTGLQVIHDMISNGTPSRDIRREFLRVGSGAGIDNKVVSFTLLLAGRDDVLVLDRIQMRNQMDDGRFGTNIYDDVINEATGKKAFGVAKLSFGHKGLMYYEAMETALAPLVKRAYAQMGRGKGSLGRYHWDSWVLASNQEVGHASVDGLVAEATGQDNAYEGTFVRNGKFGEYDYGFRYTVLPNGARNPVVDLPNGNAYVLPLDAMGSGKPLHKALTKIKNQVRKANPEAYAKTAGAAKAEFTAPWTSLMNEEQTNAYKTAIEGAGTPVEVYVRDDADAARRADDDGPAVAAAMDRGGDARDGGQVGAADRDGTPDSALGIDGGGVRGSVPVDGTSYDAAMSAAAVNLGPFAAQVSRVSPDADVQRYMLDDGATGYALDGDNIIGVFSDPTVAPKGAAQRVLADAVARGGRRLDGFDTFLPKIYAQGGFRAVARLPFSREYAPAASEGALADWDYDAMAPWNGGEPDVVFMVYDPDNANGDTDNVVPEYDDGIAAQDAALNEIGERDGQLSADAGGGTAGPRGAGAGPATARGQDLGRGGRRGRRGQGDGDGDAGTGGRSLSPARANRIKGEVLRLGRERGSSPNAIMAGLRHGPMYDYGIVERSGEGHPFLQKHGQFTAKVVFELMEMAKGAGQRMAPVYMNMATAQIADHKAKVQDALTRGMISPSDVNANGWYNQRRSPSVASGVDAPSWMDVGGPKSTSETARSVYNKAVDAAKNPLKFSSSTMERVEDKIFNRFAPIRRLEMAVRGKLGIGAESAFKAAETAVNDSGRNEQLLFYGAAKLGKYGEFTHAEGTKGLRQIFDIVANSVPEKDRGQAMMDWMGYMVARRAKDLHAKGIKTPVPEADVNKYLAKETPAFKEAADEWAKHNNANIQFLVDTGRITQAQADAMKDDATYVPFYRSDDQYADGSSPELDISKLPTGRRAGGELMRRDPNIKKMMGGDKQALNNVMINMIRNSQSFVAAGMRNDAANKTFDLMKEAGLAKAVKGKESKKPDKNAVAVWENGKKKWVVLTDPDAVPLLQAMAGLQPLQLGRIMSLMAGVGSIFRQGITLSPAFMVRNGIRGAVATGLLSGGANLTVANNTLTGFRDAMRVTDSVRAFKAQSGMGDYRFGSTDVGLGKDDILAEYGIAPKTLGYRIRSLVDKAEAVGTATELADRVAGYNSLIAKGVRPDEAAYQMRAVMDYARKGASPELRAWLPAVPFLNARLQGYSRLMEGSLNRKGEGFGTLSRKQAMAKLALHGLVLTALSGALWARNAFDDEREEQYKSEPLHRRLNYHIVYLGDKTLLIPKAFELGHLFSSIPELFADAMVNDMNEIGDGVKKIAADTVTFNLIPAMAQPIIEGMTNYDTFTGRAIEGQREQNLRAADRVTGAGTLSKFIGQQLGISDLTGLSPAMIEHYFQGYGGTYFLTASSAMDMVAGEMGFGSAPVGGAFGDMPVVSSGLQRAFGSMLKDTQQGSTKYMEEFYRNKDYITQIYRSAKDAAANGDVEYAQRLLDKAGGTPAAYKLVNKASAQLSELNRAIRDIRASTTMTPSQKRAKITPLVQARNRLVRGVAEVIHQIEEAQGSSFKGAA